MRTHAPADYVIAGKPTGRSMPVSTRRAGFRGGRRRRPVGAPLPPRGHRIGQCRLFGTSGFGPQPRQHHRLAQPCPVGAERRRSAQLGRARDAPDQHRVMRGQVVPGRLHEGRQSTGDAEPREVLAPAELEQRRLRGRLEQPEQERLCAARVGRTGTDRRVGQVVGRPQSPPRCPASAWRAGRGARQECPRTDAGRSGRTRSVRPAASARAAACRMVARPAPPQTTGAPDRPPGRPRPAAGPAGRPATAESRRRRARPPGRSAPRSHRSMPDRAPPARPA